MSKANRSVPSFETTTPEYEYRTTTPRRYNDYDYRNDNEHAIESTTPPQLTKSSDSNEFIEYRIGMKQKFNLQL